MAKVVQMNLKIPASLRLSIRAHAKIRGMKINTFLEQIISAGLYLLVSQKTAESYPHPTEAKEE